MSKPHKLFDTIMRDFGLRGDKQLADWLGVSRSTVSHLRTQTLDISPKLLLRIYSKTEYSIDDIREWGSRP